MRARCPLVAAVVALAVITVPAHAADDPERPKQYALDMVRAPQAWPVSTGRGVTIAVLDTGVDLDHPDLADNLVPGVDLVDGDGQPDDAEGHGTHVAGIAAAIAGNGRGVAGVAPAARIMPVRVLDGFGSGTGRMIAAGIRWAADHGAQVINLSAGDLLELDALHGAGDALEEDIAYAWGKGAVVVVSAGNFELAGSSAPSGYSRDAKAIIVTATDQDGGHPSWANRADTVWALSAPGVDVLSTVPNGRYGLRSGTSMAAPHVAGAAALLVAQGLTNAQVVERLLATARPLGDRSRDGAGLVDVAAAVGPGPVAAAASPAAPVTTGAPPATAAPLVDDGAGRTTDAPDLAAAPVPAVDLPAAVAGGTDPYPYSARGPFAVPPVEPRAAAVTDERDQRRARQVAGGLASVLLAAGVGGFVRSRRRA